MADRFPDPRDEIAPRAPRIGVTPSRVKVRSLSRSHQAGGWKFLVFSILGVVVAGAGFYAVASKRTETKTEMQGSLERTVTLEPGEALDGMIVREELGPYEFEVRAHDGPVIMAAGMLDASVSSQIRPDEIRPLVERGVRVESGSKHRMTGSRYRGRFYWTVINPSRDKRVEVAIKFAS